MNDTRPQIGVLGLLLEAYNPLFPGIQERQEAYLRSVLDSLSAHADFIFPGAATTREQIESHTAQFEAEDADGILIVMLSYAQGQFLVRAMKNSRLPLALALIQPDEEVGTHFGEIDLTINQGIHGSQDIASSLMRAKIPCVYYAGGRHDGELDRFVENFARAAKTTMRLRSMKIGAIGALSGMGDILTDEMTLFRTLGPQISRDPVGAVYTRCMAVSETAIAERLALDLENFDIDPQLSTESHSYAIRLYLGIRSYLEDNGYAGYTAHYADFEADGRFKQLPLLAASHLMADGYGYAAEGDIMAAVLVATFASLFDEANFSEMYMFDLSLDAILFCHAGEGNWRTAASKPRIIDRVLTEGGLGNPPTPIFAPRAGPAMVASLVQVDGEHYRLVCAKGEMLTKNDLVNCEMPYFFFRPAMGAKQLAAEWMRKGGAHHQAVVLGDHTERLALWCQLTGVEFVIL